MSSTDATTTIGNPMTIVKAGESLPFVFDRGGESVSGWVCTLVVKQYPGDTAEISRVIALDANNQWSGFLTSTETTALTGKGAYRMIGLLTHAVDGKEYQDIKRFQLNNVWAA